MQTITFQSDLGRPYLVYGRGYRVTGRSASSGKMSFAEAQASRQMSKVPEGPRPAVIMVQDESKSRG